MPRLRLLVPFPPLVVRPVLLIRRQPAHAVLAQDPVHGGARDRHLVKALEVVGDPARPEVVVLPQIQDLAHDLAWGRPRRPMGRSRAIAQARLPVRVKPSFPAVERLREMPKCRHVRATWRGSSAPVAGLQSPRVTRACSAFVIALRSRLIALRKELNVSPFYWDFTRSGAPPGIEPGMEVLQTSALPLGDGADQEARLKIVLQDASRSLARMAPTATRR